MDLWDATTLDTELNYTEPDNDTVVVEERWRQVLDNVNTIIMTSNTITLMLGMGAAISVMELWGHAKKPVGAVIGMVGQFAVLPAIGFCLSVGFKLKPYEALGVLIISCCPGGAFSNFFTYWADGDVALSIMMTACSSLLAFGGMPFNLWAYGKYWRGDDNTFVIPFANIIGSLALITGPVIVGMVVRHFHRRAAEIVTKVSGIIGWIGVGSAVIIWLILYWQSFVIATPLLYLAAFLLPSIGFILAFLLAKITCQNNKLSRTIGIETSSQNMPVAVSIILLSFDGTDIKGSLMLFPTLYGVLLILEAIVGIAIFQLYMRTCRRKKEEYPAVHTARLEPATPAEKETLRV